MILINDDLENFEENDRMPIIKFKSVPAYRQPGQGGQGESGDFEVTNSVKKNYLSILPKRNSATCRHFRDYACAQVFFINMQFPGIEISCPLAC
jgi:hypothetical protein